ncbi:hypothetical protein [Thiohalophilus sp.]|uniref:COG3014 family protein n=1 Tax=Thiohalophilus sp. TaxID=3028392 RepID=UPI002ACD8AE6|nr:hypothetical protein [Thiohalophilus sp.]MDZ7663674.1 hypothetical protein [Thiohalophilus sp.]
MRLRLPQRPVRYAGWLLAGVLLLQQSGCTTYSRNFEQEVQNLASRDPAAALEVLEKQHHPERNQLLYHLNKAMLLHMLGDYAESNNEFEQAKKIIEHYQAASISEESAAFFINDGTRTYTGSSLEQLMLHVYAAINYLLQNQVDAARVEALQIDVRLRQLQDANPDSILSIDPFVRYLTGLIYEQLGESDNAMIAYRKAYNAYLEHRKVYAINVPRILQQDLLRLSRQLGLTEEYAEYRARFDTDARQFDRDGAELIVLFHKDLAPIKRSQRIAQVDPASGYLVHFAVPVYEPRHSYLSHARVVVAEQRVRTEPMENISGIALRTLQESMPAITARALARAVIKYKMSRQAGENDGLAGLLMNIAGVISEQADTRSWLTLPGEIQMARVTLPPGDYNVTLELIGQAGQVTATRQLDRINLTRGGKRYLSYLWFPAYPTTRH